MIDIEKERKAFEAVPEIKQWVNALRYGEKTGVYIAIDNDKHEGVASWVNGAWWIWQAAQAQAVPDGFVLVPKEPTQELLNKMQDFFVGAFENGLTGGQSIHCAYIGMIEAQEQSK